MPMVGTRIVEVMRAASGARGRGAQDVGYGATEDEIAPDEQGDEAPLS